MVVNFAFAFMIVGTAALAILGGVFSPSDLDPTFGVHGLVISNVGPFTEEINDLKLQPDGKIVVAAWYENGTATICALFRYTSTGELDPTFGAGGKVLADVGGTIQSYESLVIQTDGKIVAVGRSFQSPNSYYVVSRYNPDGSLDSGFGTNGIVKGSLGTSTSDLFTSVTLQADGRIVAVGRSRQSAADEFVVARFLSDGALDTSFAGNGFISFGFGHSSAQAEAVHIRPNGKIVVAGRTSAPGGSDFAAATLNPVGTLDSSFGTDGKVVTANPGSDNPIDMGLAPDGKMVVGGDNNGSILLARYTIDGVLDTTFGTGGLAQMSIGGRTAEIAIQTNGRIVSVGVAGPNLAIVRFEADGSRDTSFGSNGVLTFPVTPGSANGVDAVALQPDGKIVLGCGTLPSGSSSWSLALARLIGDPLVQTVSSPFDYDGDGRSDLSVRRPANNVWYLQRGTAGYTAMQFGVAGDRMVPADYDGDGKTDVAVFRPSNGNWYIYMSQSQTFQQFGWGQDGDMPVPTDRDADGKADLVIYRESNNTWYTRFANATFNTFQFGVAGDKPMLGDFDGDGIGDVALFRPSNNNWYLLKSSLGFFVQTWGQAGDLPLTGDFDGDGATDQAVFRPGTGQWFLSRTTAGFSSQNWGQNGDIPVAADYDGDGKTDVAVFRPSTGTWYIVQSSAGILYLPFGQDGDVPTQASYIY